MYYRRKVILALLQQFGGELRPVNLQKLLLIFTQKQKSPAYHFVPYKYGAYSFHARADKGTMIKYEMLKNSKRWVFNACDDYIGQLNKTDRKILKDVYANFKDHSSEDLIRFTYRNYPYYAIHSDIAEKYLEEEDVNRINMFRPVNKDCKLYTIGYEGIKAEEYINKLIQKDVKLLVDVRKNSLSMKYGFNKSQLKSMCNKMGIEFVHISELGIESKKRKNLDSKAEYQELFEEYEQETLPEATDQLERLYKLYQEYQRVAISCFEKEHTCCHRHKISDHLQEKYGIQIEHL